MAGSWIKYDTDTAEKPEVWAMAQDLDIDPDCVVGKLLRVWTWFDSHTEDGIAPASSKALLDRKVGIDAFCSAMIRAGWMIEADGVISLPNFDKHNGSTGKKRAETARRVANHRNKSNADVTENNANGNDRVAIPRPIRRAVMERDHSTCVYCGRKDGEYTPPETKRDSLISIDHVIPLTAGGSNEISNLVAACVPCNNYKNNRTPEEAGLEWPVNETGERYGCVTKSVTSALPRKEKKREERKAIAPAARDPIWDAVISACGLTDRTPTKSERGGWNKAVAELKEINVTPKQIHERAAEYRRNWPNVSLTPNALARRWNECAPSNPGSRAKTIDTMTEMQLVEECRKRGINDNGMSVQQMRRALKEAA